MPCIRCLGIGWVCENHPSLPWPDVCECGAGEPCRDCSPFAPQMRADRARWYWSGPSVQERRDLRRVGRRREPIDWGSDGPSVLRTMRRRRTWKR